MESVLGKIFYNLLETLLGDDYELRKWSLTTLSRLQGETAGEIIFERYQCDNLEDYLALAISKVDPEKASEILVASLNDSQPEVRLKAAEALIGSKSEAAARVLVNAVEAHIQILESQTHTESQFVSEEALISAIKALGGIGSNLCQRALKKLAPLEPNAKVRAKAISVLGKFSDDSTITFFQAFLSDQDPRVCANAIESIEKAGSKGVVGILHPYLDATHQRIKANAAKAIWKHGDFGVTQTIKEMVKSKEKSQLVSALYLIGETKHPEFFSRLVQLSKNPDTDIRRNVVIALKKFGDIRAKDCLLPLLNDPEEEVRLQAIYAYSGIIGEEALEIFSKKLKTDPSAVVRSALISEMGKHGNETVLGDLVNSLKDPDPRVVSNALEAIPKVFSGKPSDELIEKINENLTSKSNRVRANAIQALWGWGIKESLSSLEQMLSSDDKQLKISGLHCLGEVFSKVSADKEGQLKTFEKILQEAFLQHRKLLSEKMSKSSLEKIQSLFIKINQELRNERTSEAAMLLEKVLEISPVNVKALALLADIHFQAKDFNSAEKTYLSALELEPNLGKAHFSLGVIHHSRGEWKRATERLLAALKINPKIPQAYLLLSESLEHEGRLGESLHAMKRLYSMVPQNQKVVQRLSLLSFLCGEIKEALQLTKRIGQALEDDPTFMLIQATGEYLEKNPELGFLKLFNLIQVLTKSGSEGKPSKLERFLRAAKTALEAVNAF